MITRQDQSDDRARMAELWHQWQPTISAYLLAAVPNYHDAEDLLQQVAVAVARDFDKYDPATPFGRWAIAIARHRVLNFRRSKAMSKVVFSQETMDALAEAVPDKPPVTSDFKTALDRCLGRLQERARAALSLRYEQDLRAQQIATKLDMSANAVSVLLHRSRKALEQCMRSAFGSEAR